MCNFGESRVTPGVVEEDMAAVDSSKTTREQACMENLYNILSPVMQRPPGIMAMRLTTMRSRNQEIAGSIPAVVNYFSLFWSHLLPHAIRRFTGTTK